MNEHLSLAYFQSNCSDTLEEAKRFCVDQRVKIIARTWADEESIVVKGKVTDYFNFVNHMSLTKNVRTNEIANLSCDCIAWKRKRQVCAHCIALGLESGILSVEAPSCDSKDLTNKDVIVEETIEVAPEILGEDKRYLKVSKPLDENSSGDEEVKGKELEDETGEKIDKLIHLKEKGSMQIVFGVKEDGEQVIWRPNDTNQTVNFNMGIIGTMGTGKTQFTKSLITQLKRQWKDNYDGSPINMLIFDYKGDYNISKPEFINAVNAEVTRPYKMEFNPFAIYQTENFTPLLPTHIANGFIDTLNKICSLGIKQKEYIIQCIMDAYHEAGIDEEDPNTWDRVAPTFDQVYKKFSARSDANDSLTAVMNKINRFHVFEKDPMKAKPFSKMMKGVRVIDISGYEKDMQDLVVAITLDQFYSYMYSLGSSKTDGRYRQITNLILVDEADGIMSRKFDTLKNILKEGREFGVGVILSTQLLSHFGTGTDVYSSYIFTWIIHRVNDLSAKDISMLLGDREKGDTNAVDYSRIKELVKHQSMVKIMDAKPAIIQDLPFWELLQQCTE